jgi:hypothetical protein
MTRIGSTITRLTETLRSAPGCLLWGCVWLVAGAAQLRASEGTSPAPAQDLRHVVAELRDSLKLPGLQGCRCRERQGRGRGERGLHRSRATGSGYAGESISHRQRLEAADGGL